MRINLQKIKHLYFIYGVSNSFLVLLILIVAALFYYKYSNIDELNQRLNAELVKTQTYRSLSSELINKNFFRDNASMLNKNEEIEEFINELKQSEQIINNLENEYTIGDVHYNEILYSLKIDYNSLIMQNELLFKYLYELGNNSQGLYYNFKKARIDFSEKIKDFNVSPEIEEQFNYLKLNIDIFLNTQSEKIAENIDNKLLELGEQLKYLESSDNYMAIRVLDAYKNFTNNYYEFAKRVFEIGPSGKKGLLLKVNKTYFKITHRLNETSDLIIQEKAKTRNWLLIFVGLMLLFSIALNVFALFFFIRIFDQFILVMIRHIRSLDKGVFEKIDKSKVPFEIHGVIEGLEAVSNKLINSMNIVETFSRGKTSIEIEKEKHFPFFYTNLLKLKQNIETLNQNVREEKKKQTNMLWIKSGIDKLTEVMRRKYDNPLLHANEIINMLVRFLNIPIGAIYHLKQEGDTKYIEMAASFAYGKEKQLYKKIAFGEGIVGTSASERKTLNVTNVPEGYFKIISGFGEARPKNLLVSPIKLEDEIYGVIELASLSRFKQEEIDFVEEVCKTLAFSFAISQVYMDTLVQFEDANMEIAQLEAENTSLSNDYEDLNKNYQKLTEQGADNSFIVNRLNEIALIADLDLDGNIKDLNNGFEQFFKTPKAKFLNTNFREYLMEINQSIDIDLEFVWREARAGIQHEIDQKIRFLDNDYWLNQHFFPVKDEKGRVKKIKIIAFDITEKMKLDQELSDA